MKKFTFLLVAMFLALGISAQTLSTSGAQVTAQLPEKAEVDLHFDGDPYTSIGVNGPAVFIVAARFTMAELAVYYDEYYISKVKFLPILSSDTGETWATGARVLIYGEGTSTEPGQLLVDQTVDGLVEGWNEFVLPEPLLLDNYGDYWVGYEVKTEAGFPAACDAGPMVPGKGGWLYMESDGWFEMSAAGLDYNWNIRATLTDELGVETEIGLASYAFGGNGMITINNANAATAQIFNIAGQLVNTVNLSKSTTVQVPAGVYVVRVGNAVQKVLVK